VFLSTLSIFERKIMAKMLFECTYFPVSIAWSIPLVSWHDQNNSMISCLCAEWCVSLGRGHDWLTNEILWVLFCSVDLDRVRTNIKEGAHQGYDTFGEGWIRINMVPDGTHTITSPLVRAINSTNQIARYSLSHNLCLTIFKIAHAQQLILDR
jgi:hypothetical protein